ncbi:MULTISPECIES: glycosyltransferase [Aureimonas]|uniref:glycosyltransferase family 4 protein n=1 Tax=Aureimonas TaxID=414371 RepID=UPI0019D58E90|nr:MULTISPECIES: glycosyltransferase [Aureimonas]
MVAGAPHRMAGQNRAGIAMKTKPKVLIVSENASMMFGGEASLPWHYFTRLRGRGVDTWLVVHERTRAELARLAPEALDRIHFIPDNRFNIFCWKMGAKMPAQLGDITFGYASRIANQIEARRLVRRLVRQNGISVVHQPIPVSPREPSLMVDVGAPVVMGPMNGNMSYPPAMQARAGGTVQKILRSARALSDHVHGLMRGKREAALLLVANQRTRMGLPPKCRGAVVELVENGIDTELWQPGSAPASGASGDMRLLFLGRLVDWKAVDIVLEAVGRLPPQGGVTLDIIGDGPMRQPLQALAEQLGLDGKVRFHGFLPQPECAAAMRNADALVLPSLYECGGAVVLEAMAAGVPVIATAWGGPLDYLDASCGILIEPTSRDDLVAGFATAIGQLASEPERRAAMGQAGRNRALRNFDWDDKISRMLVLYEAVAAGRPLTDADVEPTRPADRLVQHQFMLRPSARQDS